MVGHILREEDELGRPFAAGAAETEGRSVERLSSLRYYNMNTKLRRIASKKN
jgi:hypothetical protein